MVQFSVQGTSSAGWRVKSGFGSGTSTTGPVESRYPDLSTASDTSDSCSRRTSRSLSGSGVADSIAAQPVRSTAAQPAIIHRKFITGNDAPRLQTAQPH